MCRLRGRRHRVWLGVLGLVVAASGGCSQRGYSGPTGTVTGSVTLDGKPVPQGCLISFVSAEGLAASGKVGADGKYELVNVNEPEIPVGTYRVSVTPPAVEMSDADYDSYMSGAASGKPKTPPPAIPARFQSFAASGLSFDVKQGTNTINIDLK